MRSFDIACLPGDGPGPLFLDGVEKAVRILEAKMRETPEAFHLNCTTRPMGLAAIKTTGKTLPKESLDAIRNADAALMGMIDLQAEHTDSAIGPMRRELMLYADIRPVKTVKGVWALRPDIDIVCIRESTEGFLADRNMFKGTGEMMPTEDAVISMRVVTRAACRRIAVFAFEYAHVLHMGCGMFLNTVRDVARDYPDIRLEDDFVDSVANKLIAAPERYDIIVTTNLMGDILSDEASALVSGLSGAANIGDDAAVFFPVSHLVDSASCRPGEMNPAPVFLCAGLMLRHLGLTKAADAFEAASAEAAGEFFSGGPEGKPGAAERYIDAVCGKLA